MIQPKDERNLTAGFRRGDPDSLRAVYREFAPRVHGFALRLTGQRLDAEDLTQEVFIAACAGSAGYDGRSRLLTWLLGIAVRRWRDMNRRGRVESVPLIDERDLERSSMREGASKGQSLEMQTIDNLLLERALLQLGDRERETLLLVASQGLTYKEAAQALGEPVGTVKWRVSTASRRMQAILLGYENDEKETEDKADAPRSPSMRR